jgi:hypothetical protein
MNVLITLTTAGVDTGPFDLFSNSNNYTVPFASTIARGVLENGYLSSVVPNDATIIRVQSLDVCTNYIDLTINTTTTTTSTSTAVPQQWYRIVNCNTLVTLNSIAYSPGTYGLNARVTYQNYPYVVNQIYNTNPGGSQVALISTGQIGCPPLGEYYLLFKCSDATTTTSQKYPVGTFVVDDRVVDDSDIYTYTIVSASGNDPGGAQISISATGQRECPTTVYTQYTKCTDVTIKYYILGSGYQSSILIGDDCFTTAGTTLNPEGTEFYSYSEGCEC